jgi:carboxylesterase type B
MRTKEQLLIIFTVFFVLAFAGDPNAITLQGHSAGATSICLHLIAPASQNLFQRAIIESGGCDIIHSPLAQMEMIGDEISSHFCNSSPDAITCLQSLNASTLLQYAKSQNYLNIFIANSFRPPIDGLIIPDSITNLFQRKAFSTNISLLTGTANGEFGLFIGGRSEPGWQVHNLSQSVLSQWVQLYSNGQSAYLNATYNPYVDPNVPAELVNYYGLNDALSTYRYQCPVRRTAAYLINSGSRSVYLYSFEYVPLSSLYAYLSQAVHGQELPFVFNSPNSLASSIKAFNPDEQLLAWAISLLWTRFAVSGNPNIPLDNETTNPLINQLNDLGGWSMYSTTNSSTYIIVSNRAVGNSSATIRLGTRGYHSPTCAAWDEIVPNVNITKRCNTGYTGPNCTQTNNGTSSTASFIGFSMLPILVPIYYQNYF